MSRVLEQGDVYFAYRPRVQREHPEGVEDVQRFYAVLRPRGREVYRRLVMGRKRLPDASERERFWAFVDKVARAPGPITRDLQAEVYETRTRGRRHQPAARSAGEGFYAIVDHDGHAHLAYALELPEAPGEVQQALRIDPRANYIAAVRNPDAPSAPGFGLLYRERPRYPAPLRERFRGRRFAPLDPAFLDHEGAELVLIGAGGAPEEDLGVHLEARHDAAEGPFAAPLNDGAWE
jgi:hypothetical protein